MRNLRPLPMLVAFLSAAALSVPAFAAGPTAKVGAWLKTCSGATFCMVQQQARDAGRKVVGGFTVYVEAGKPPKASVRVPTGPVVGPDVKFVWRIDTGTPIETTLKFCGKEFCLAEFPLDDATVAALHKGTVVHIAATDKDGKSQKADLTLKDFATVYDGKDFLTLDELTALIRSGGW